MATFKTHLRRNQRQHNFITSFFYTYIYKTHFTAYGFLSVDGRQRSGMPKSRVIVICSYTSVSNRRPSPRKRIDAISAESVRKAKSIKQQFAATYIPRVFWMFLHFWKTIVRVLDGLLRPLTR